MKLRIDDITAEARQLLVAEAEQEINRVLARGAGQEYFIKSPVQVSLSYYRAGGQVFVSGTLDAATRAVCARCAEDCELVSRRAFRYVLTPRTMGDDKEFPLRAEDLEFSVYQGDEVDLSPLIREQVLLALTSRPLCREECRGLCPRCGTNLNEQDCKCRADSSDTRFALFRDLKVGH